MKKIFYCLVVSLFMFMGTNTAHAIGDKFSPRVYDEIRLKASAFDIDEKTLVSVCEDACDMCESTRDKMKPLYKCLKDYVIHLWLAQMSEKDATHIKTAEDVSDMKQRLSKYINDISDRKFVEFYNEFKTEIRSLMMEKWRSANKKADDMVIAMREQEAEFISTSVLGPFPMLDEMITLFCEWYSEEFLMKNFLIDRDVFKSILSRKVEDFLVSYCFMQRYPDCVSTVALKVDSEELESLIERSYEIISKENVIVNLPKEPVLVVGDLHGNEFSLAKSIRVGRGELLSGGANSVIFLGDYVDRGFHSVEVLERLLRLKLEFPDKVFLLRGNHEDAIVEPNTFVAELNKKFGLKKGSMLCDLFYRKLFKVLPVALQVSLDNGKKVFCAHAGFPDPFKSKDMELFSRLRELSTREALDRDEFKLIVKSILWNDPERADKPKVSRGTFSFSQERLDAFLKIVGCDYLVRGHEFIMSGFAEELDGKCYTIFSSANYFNHNCGMVAQISSKGIRPFAKILQRDIEMLITVERK